MPNIFKLPLTNVSQQLGVVLVGVAYQFTVTWRNAASLWFLDIADANGIPLIQGIPLVTGVDLLGQFKTLDLGGSLLVLSDGNDDPIPGYADLGVSSQLVFVVP